MDRLDPGAEPSHRAHRPSPAARKAAGTEPDPDGPGVAGPVPDDAPASRPGWTLTRRQFVGAAGAAGGLAVSGALAGCSVDTDTPAPSVEEATITLTVNGEPRRVPVDSRTSLLDLLRERIGLTGTKKGCNQGACGACTVLLDDRRIVSCLTLAIRHDGAEVTTVEGLADGDRLHPVQQAFIDHDGFQCGFCTSGQIMSGVGCIREGHTGSPAEIREWMSGNICRCGAYTNIVAAVAQAAREQ